MEISVDQKDISCKMFDFLCNVVGSEQIVKNRRLFFKISDDVISNGEYTCITSGSKAEGLNMNGSDLDIMLVNNQAPVYHSQSEIDNNFGLVTDTENAAPGFVLLQLPYGNIPYTTYSEYGVLLASDEFKQTLLHRMNEVYPKYMVGPKIHGPCISTDQTDVASCLKSQSWPNVCTKWFQRPKYSTWPSSNDVVKIAKEGLLYVPIGSKFGSKNENSKEWRISFSVPEKILIHSFNHAQLICYALLKIVLSDVINKNSHTSNLFCSYFMKTVVLWLAEESDPSSWNPETLFTCFQACLDRLIYWVRIGYCPNYFIVENNMFEGKIVGKCQQYLLHFLTILRKEGLQIMNRSETLSKFYSNNIRFNDNDSEEQVKAIYPLMGYLCLRAGKSNYQILQRIRGHVVNGNQLIKSLYILWLARYYLGIVETKSYEFHTLNKHFYRSYKLLLSHCLIAKNLNVVSGGFILAAFFYRHKEYEKSLSVLNYSLPECTREKCYLSCGSFIEKNVNINSNISFLQRYKLSYIHECFIILSLHSALHIEELEIPVMHRQCRFIAGSPNLLIHYLRCLCFHYLGNFIERNRCLVDIKLATEEGFLSDHWYTRNTGIVCLLKAGSVTNCWEEYAQVYIKFWKELFTWCQTYVQNCLRKYGNKGF